MRLRLSALLFACLATPLALAQHTHLAAGSVWTLNAAKSDFGGGPSMKSDVFVMVTDTEKWGKLTDTADFGDGKLMKMSWSGPEDGTPRPLVGVKGTFATNAATDVTTEVIDSYTQTCKFSLSADKKIFSEKCTAKLKDGKMVQQTIVYDRTK